MISEDLAISKGISVAKTNLLYLFLGFCSCSHRHSNRWNFTSRFSRNRSCYSRQKLELTYEKIRPAKRNFRCHNRIHRRATMERLQSKPALSRTNGGFRRHYNFCCNRGNQLEIKNNYIGID